MKQEIGSERPAGLKEDWPGQYDMFSHFEFVAGVPHALFLITTVKENGLNNAGFHAWSAFTEDLVVMTGFTPSSHTYVNIMRDKEFCVNFLNPSYYDACLKTIEHNGPEEDELLASGLTPEPAVTVKPPRIKEAFITYECTLESVTDLKGNGRTYMIVGRIRHAAVEDSHHTVASICGDEGFMFYIHAPKDLDGGGENGAIARLQALREE